MNFLTLNAFQLMRQKSEYIQCGEAFLGAEALTTMEGRSLYFKLLRVTRELFPIRLLFGLLGFTWLALPSPAQSISTTPGDRLQREFRKSKSDSNRVKLWLQLGEYHVDKPAKLQPDIDTAYGYAKKAENLSLSLRFARGYDQSQFLLARIYLESNRMEQVNALLPRSKSGKNKTALLLLLGQHYLKRPRELQADLDSAEGYVRQALADLSVGLNDAPGQVEGLALLGSIYSEKGNPSKARAYLQQAFPIMEQLKDPMEEARLWNLLGDGFSNSKEDVPKKINCNEKALVLYRQLKNKEQEAATLKEIADLHMQQGKLAQSLGELIEVLRIQKSINYSNLHYTYDLLEVAYERIGNYGEALPYALAAIESAKATGDTVSMDFFHIRLGNLYTTSGEHQKALEVFRGILARQQNGSREKEWIIYCTGQISKQLLALNRPTEARTFLRQTLKRYPPNSPPEQVDASFFLGETYLHLKSYALAEANFLKALKILSSKNYLRNEDRLTVFINQNLARLYRETGQYRKAHFCLRQAFTLAGQRKFIKELSETHLQAFQLDSLQGNFPSAITHYQQYKALNDSIFNEKKSNQLIGFQVQYNTQKKEQEIKLKEKNIALLTQRSKAQQASIRQRNTQLNALIGGTALLLAMLALVYNRYSIKQRSNGQLQAQQLQINEKNNNLQRLLTEKEWMMKEIHHRVKNNLQLITGLLYSQAAYLQDPAASAAIRESHNRVYAMGLIHQHLYQFDNLQCVNIDVYIQEIITHLLDTFNYNNSVQLQLDVSALELDISLAVPLGLIINEALTNALKYAFPNSRPGIISVELQPADSLTSMDGHSYRLTIADNGIGMPAGLDFRQSRTLGLSMIQGLSRQIQGKLEIIHDTGVKINLLFNTIKRTRQDVFFN